MDSYTFFAQSLNIGGANIQGPLVGINNAGDLINVLMTFLVPFAAIILFFVLLWGGYDFLSSAGNEDKINTAKAKITAGLIGFFLLVSSYLIVSLIAQIFGLGGGLF